MSSLEPRYAGEFPRELFRKHGIAYDLAKQTKSNCSAISFRFLNSGRGVLPRNDRLQSQIVGLERRTSAVGRDTISHPDRGHDDVAMPYPARQRFPNSANTTPAYVGCRATMMTAAPGSARDPVGFLTHQGRSPGSAGEAAKV